MCSTGQGRQIRTYPIVMVLLFTDMSPRKDQDDFCEGVAEEIINVLSGVEGREFLSVCQRLSGWALALNSPHHQFSFTLGQSSDGCFECESKYTRGGNRRHLPRATDERTKKTHRSQAGRGMGGRSISQISCGVNKVVVLGALRSC